jgi:hypothetical protein
MRAEEKAVIEAARRFARWNETGGKGDLLTWHGVLGQLLQTVAALDAAAPAPGGAKMAVELTNTGGYAPPESPVAEAKRASDDSIKEYEGKLTEARVREIAVGEVMSHFGTTVCSMFDAHANHLRDYAARLDALEAAAKRDKENAAALSAVLDGQVERARWVAPPPAPPPPAETAEAFRAWALTQSLSTGQYAIAREAWETAEARGREDGIEKAVAWCVMHGHTLAANAMADRLLRPAAPAQEKSDAR